MSGTEDTIPDKDVNSHLPQEAVVYCICRSPIANVFMISCDFCQEWYHGTCIGITEEMSERINEYYCMPCKRKNPSLRTTYKKVKRKRKSRTNCKIKKLISMNHQRDSNVTSNQNYVELNTIKTPASAVSTTSTNKCFDFVDTTNRNAKTEAYNKFKRLSITEKIYKADKMEHKKIKKQCYGPSCTKSSRKNSKYCSKDCGITLARNRIEVTLPQIMQWNSTPSAADELSCKKLADIRAKLHVIEEQLEELEIRTVKLIEKILNSKNPQNNFVEEQCEDTTVTHCILCGSEIPYKFLQRHLEQCYRRKEKNITTDDKIKPIDDDIWNIFCNRKISKNSWCKKLKVLCPFHYNNSRKADEVCGYYLGEENGIEKYCGNKGRTCSHLNWEENCRADLDREKLTLLLKYKNLQNEEEEIRGEMTRRGDVLSLMNNFTIEH